MKSKLLLLIMIFFALESCGPVVLSARLNNPPPPWFYPNRIEPIRYIYFPNYYIYYDLSLSTYYYLDNNVWISARVLPSRFNGINLRRSRQIRINNYFGDNIQRYHRENRSSTNRRRSTSTRRNRRN